MEIYLHQNGERSGPYTLEKYSVLARSRAIDRCRCRLVRGCSDWVTVQDVPGIMLPGGDHLVNVSTVPPFEAYQGDEPLRLHKLCHKDAAVVYEEITRLHEAGINVWYDEGIEASNEWPEESPGGRRLHGFPRVRLPPSHGLGQLPQRNQLGPQREQILSRHSSRGNGTAARTPAPHGRPPGHPALQAPRRPLPKENPGQLDNSSARNPQVENEVSIAQQTEAVHEPESAEQVVHDDAATVIPKTRRKGLAVALALPPPHCLLHSRLPVPRRRRRRNL